MNHLSDLDAFLAGLGKSGNNKEPPVSESPERTSIAWLVTLPARLRIIESNLAMLGIVYRHWDASEMHRLNSVETSLEPSFKASKQESCAMCNKNTSANNTNNCWHRTSSERKGYAV